MKRFGKYEIGEELGRGGTAVVYRAKDTNMGLDVALKVLNGEHSGDPAFVERFRQETRIAAGLSHPAIVRLFDFGMSEGQVYVAMQLVEGRTLRDWLMERGRLTVAEALPIVRQVAQALVYLQERGLAHRDLKPANILLEEEVGALRVTLVDFGLVHSLEQSTYLTRTLVDGVGTPAYFAPEQADGEKWGEVTALTDVYALGVLCYELVVGEVPFKGNALAMTRGHADSVPPSPLGRVPTLGVDAAGVLVRGLEKKSQARYPSALALVDALEAVQTNRRQAVAREKTLADLIAQAETAREGQQWLTLNRLCSEIAEIDRTYPSLMDWMIAAQQGLAGEIADDVARRKRTELYEAGLAAMEAAVWEEAAEKFKEVAEGNPDFRAVQTELAKAQGQVRRAGWFFEGVALDEQEKWGRAARVWQKLLQEDWRYREGEAVQRLGQTLDGLLPEFDTLLTERNQLDTRLSSAGRLVQRLLTGVRHRTWDEVAETSRALQGELSISDATVLEWYAVYADKQLAQQSVAKPVEKKGVIVWEKDGKEMVLIPAGKFLMGSPKDTENQQLDETPQHKGYLLDYYIDRTPVTNGEYAQFMKDGGYGVRELWLEAEAAGRWHKGQYVNAGNDNKLTVEPRYWQEAKKWNGAQQPVVGVSWYEALAYARWAGKRLPTEAEWEKAARGEDGRAYPWGTDWVADRANTKEAGLGQMTPVGTYSPEGDSPYGVVDMSGNVWEWCSTRSGSTYPYKADDGREDLRGGDAVGRILRGGSWYDEQTYSRCAIRHWSSPFDRYYNYGFRCCATFSLGSGS